VFVFAFAPKKYNEQSNRDCFDEGEERKAFFGGLDFGPQEQRNGFGFDFAHCVSLLEISCFSFSPLCVFPDHVCLLVDVPLSKKNIMQLALASHPQPVRH